MPGYNDIIEVFKAVRSNIDYESDQKVFGMIEHWKSWKKEISQGKSFIRDDCDGFALTMAEMLLEKGFNPEDVAICFCAITRPGYEDEYHLLCKVRNPENQVWYVMDNNVDTPQKRAFAGGPGWKFKYISCMYADKPGEWVEDA